MSRVEFIQSALDSSHRFDSGVGRRLLGDPDHRIAPNTGMARDPGGKPTGGNVLIQTVCNVHEGINTQTCGHVNDSSAQMRSVNPRVLRHERSMILSQKIIDGLRRAEPNMASLARKARLSHDQVSRLFSGKTRVNYEHVAAMLEAVGAEVVFPDERHELAQEIRWVDAKVVPAGQGQQLPPADSYFAVPLVGEAGAGPGIMPTEEIKSWVLVYRHQHAIRFKRNLLAVEIDKGSTSMVPLLRPGDIVLVDRDDFRPDKPGGIFLVREPGQDGGAMVKRVAAKQENGDTLVTFYSDNAAENPPDTYSLKAHYDGEIAKAIVGRCIWSWADLSGK